MDYQASILLVGKPGHMRDALAGLINSLPFPESTHPFRQIRLLYACDCRQAVEMVRENAPAVVLIAGAPFDSEADTESLRDIRRTAPDARCLVLTETPGVRSESRYPSADAVLPITTPFDQLQATIEVLLSRV